MTYYEKGVRIFDGFNPITLEPYCIIINKFRRFTITFDMISRKTLHRKERPWIDIARKNSMMVSKEQQERELAWFINHAKELKRIGFLD